MESYVCSLGMPKHIALTPIALQPFPSGGDDVNSTVLALRTLGSFDFQGIDSCRISRSP